jgi:hypothetical protein
MATCCNLSQKYKSKIECQRNLMDCAKFEFANPILVSKNDISVLFTIVAFTLNQLVQFRLGSAMVEEQPNAICGIWKHLAAALYYSGTTGW